MQNNELTVNLWEFENHNWISVNFNGRNFLLRLQKIDDCKHVSVALRNAEMQNVSGISMSFKI